MTEAEYDLHLRLLPRFSPFDSIEEEVLAKIAKDVTIYSKKPGFKLFENGDYDADEYYLINGEVNLTATDGRQNVVVAKTSSTRFPIARLRPRMYTAEAKTTIRYFTINSSVLDELQLSLRKQESDVIVQEVRQKAGDDGSSLLYEFEQELNTGRFVLPSLPEVAFKIRELIENPDCSMQDVAKLVNTDPAIATKLVKVANSVMYRGVNTYDNAQDAIARLGMITTKQLVTSFAMLALFNTKSSHFADYMRKLWQQSVDVAAYCYVLAKHLPGFNEEEALMAGLVHRIGDIVLLSYAERFQDLKDNQKQLDKLMDSLRGRLGEMVLTEWEFNEQLVTVARESLDWTRGEDNAADDAADFDYCDLVQVAMLYTLEASAEQPLPEVTSTPAFKRLQVRQLGNEKIAQIVYESNEQIAELRQIFS